MKSNRRNSLFGVNYTAATSSGIASVTGHAEEASPDTDSGLYAAGLKRLFDIAVVVMAMPFILPWIALAALAITLSDGANPFYSQDRVGRDGRIFRMWKLRSMVPNAKKMLETHLAANPDARREWDAYQKLRHDPRITRIGRIIRKTSIDELPQLFNVLIGDMSLVGPRPIMTEQKCLYPGSAYFRLRPGITGFWQVSDRNDSTFAERALFDTRYENECTFMVDVGVMLRTVSVIVKANGH